MSGAWRDYYDDRPTLVAGGDIPFLHPVPLSQLDTTPPAPLLLGRLDPSEPTVLFGPGGAGKGALACWYAVQLAAEGKRVLILDFEDHGSEWARRVTGLGGDVNAIEWVAPLRDGLRSLTEAAPSVRAYIVANDIDYVIIDSAVMACGEDPLKPEAARSYFAALQLLDVPSLTLAHVTKMDDPRYPFGSVFWHNLARMTWSLMPKGEDTVLTCRKASNYQKPPAVTVELDWWNGSLRNVHERRAVDSLMDRVIEALADGPMTAPAVTSALNDGLPAAERIDGTTVRRTLKRELKHGPAARVTLSGDQWVVRPE